MLESTFQPSPMVNSWCLDDPYGIIRQFCAESASIGDNTADLITDNGISVVAASAGSPSCSDNSVGIFFDQDFAFPSMGWATGMYDSIVPMEAAGDNIHSTSLSRPVDPRVPCLQGTELFFGAHVEGTVSSEMVEQREEAVDEGYEQRHLVRRNALAWSRGGVGLRSARGHQWFHLVTNVMGVDKRLGGFVAYLEREVNGAVACFETNTSTTFEGVQQAIIAYLMEEEVLEVRRQEMRGRFREELLVALGMSRKRKRDDREDSSEE
ncbi:hypothetical protein C355_06227 [Cryptococcus neoformans Th84]|nr:hypothetical protein C355_06227 [Cryptococcus neoformans var. grubii Th84]